MKAIRWIQNVVIVAAVVMALYLADSIEISCKDALSASLLIVLAVVTLLGRALEEERRAE